jgi:hypothetical protein
MIVILQYKNFFKRFISHFIPFTARVFAVDMLKGHKPVGVQRLTLNTSYQIPDRFQICFAGDLPKDPKKSVDPDTIQKYVNKIDILKVQSFQNTVTGKDNELTDGNITLRLSHCLRLILSLLSTAL